ncbi:hypothetical protein Mapa_013422 [Marchantia paleacea]|nr:hypothetical protein Mapa_013422 [Marchantia paleacea]
MIALIMSVSVSKTNLGQASTPLSRISLTLIVMKSKILWVDPTAPLPELVFP